MNETEVKVSILCLAYNHGKYLRQALDGFLAQKTDFAYEIIIHDDASTDDTQQIIMEYAQKYPELIRPVLQTQNQYSRNVHIMAEFLNPLARGKYIALCEGDDYWTDPDKLQLQYNIMESHPECSMCVHRIERVLEDGSFAGKYQPAGDMEEGKIDTVRFLEIQRSYPFQTGCFFMRADLWFDLEQNPPHFRMASDVGDEPALLYMVAHGDLYYLPRCMSAYRIFSAGSWSSKNKNTLEKRLVHARHFYEMMRLFDEYTNHQFDCRLDLFRGKVLWLSENYRELARKENRDCMKYFSPAKRLYIYLCAVLPFASGLRKRIIQLMR